MKGEIEIERAKPNPAAARLEGQALNFPGRTRKRHRPRGIDRGDLGRTVDFGKKGAGIGGIEG